jgi:prepilin signal peptidase PulO-like enzyme (type II secretory pathway)
LGLGGVSLSFEEINMDCGCEERKVFLKSFCSTGGHVYSALGVAGLVSVYMLFRGYPGGGLLFLITVLVAFSFFDLRVHGY